MSRFCSVTVSVIVALAASRAAAATIRVTVDMVSYTPAQVSAHVGDTIEWVNNGFLAHAETGRKKEWDLFIPPRKSMRVTLTHPGEIDYYCRFHPNLVGHVSVAPP